MRFVLMVVAIAVLLSACAGFPVAHSSITNQFTYDRSDRLAIIANNPQNSPLLPDALSTALIGLGYVIVDRNQIDKLLKEYKYSYTGVVEEYKYDVLGKIANIKFLLVVNSRELLNGAVASATVQMIDVVTGKVVDSTTYSQPVPENPVYVGHDNLDATATRIAQALDERITHK